jgi:hypothetical protein
MANPAFGVTNWTTVNEMKNNPSHPRIIQVIQDGGQPIVFRQNIPKTKKDMKNRYRSFTSFIKWDLAYIVQSLQPFGLFDFSVLSSGLCIYLHVSTVYHYTYFKFPFHIDKCSDFRNGYSCSFTSIEHTKYRTRCRERSQVCTFLVFFFLLI